MGQKRKAEHSAGGDDKRAKSKKQWRTPKTGRDGAPYHQPQNIEPGDTGIFVTCHRSKESKCTGEMKDLLDEYGEKLHQTALDQDKDDGADDGADGEGDIDDIEKEIKAEVQEIRKPKNVRLFTPIQLNTQCVIFFKTAPQVEPVSLVKTICEDAMSENARKRTRFAQRLTPMTLMGRASMEGLEQVALKVLAPHFHQEPFKARTFAIRPTIRNHNILTRDSVIKQVASLVGTGHQVDLTNYELLIIVEVYQHICGISVVDNDFERLKRYNISEIFEPTPKEESKAKTETE
ncbi:Putative THUMP domain-containing protein [Septoria linicola]|uniref:THUMP domain-containing protein n=1 Tax=Septoria linicola TaxID=215465 RepID=A0A9Q9B113_9PEZI|nr:putative THUMP domain-containing protein [Septoria linicola]USW58999.1 Putative THUMP domain-containing protein [Septoria linicola]